MYRESEINNILVHQKDAILNELRCALEQDPNWTIAQEQITNPEIVQHVLALLEFNCELWKTLNYAYKGQEITQRIKNAARHSLANLHHAASKKRKSLNVIIHQCDSLQF